MVSGIRTIYPCGLNKGFSSKFCVSAKSWEYNNEVEDNSPNILGDKKYRK